MTKRHTLRSGMSLCLAGTVLLGTLNISVLAAEPEQTFSDTKGHWASQAIERMSGYKIINGYNGLFRPNDPITRGEMSIIIDHVMRYQKSAVNDFVDLEQAFYTDAVLKAYEADLLLQVDGLVRPKDNITRQEVAFMIYNAFDIEPSKDDLAFLDADQVADWAMESVSALAAKEAIVGGEGKFRPEAPITRAEAVTILNRLLAGYYNVAGTYTGMISGTTVINASDANLKDVVIKGDLIIAEGVAEGDVILENVTVEGRTIIRGGGVNSIKVKGHSKIKDVVMAKENSAVRLVVSESAEVSNVTIDQRATDVVVGGKIDTINIEANVANVIVQDADIQEIKVIGETAKIGIEGKTNIKSLNVSEQAIDAQINVAKDVKVQTINADAKATISGDGKVSKVNANANDINVQTAGTVVEAGKGTTGVIAGKEPVQGGSTANTTKPSGGSEDSSNNNNNNKPEEEPLSISKVESVKNGLVRVTFNRATDKALTKDRFSIICTSGGKDMTVLDVYTNDNKVYDLRTSYYDDNTYSLGVLLEDGKLIEKEFISKYDCPEITSTQITRVSATTAEFTFVSDTPGTFYYGLGIANNTRQTFVEEPTAEELIAKGTKVEMKNAYNELKIDSLEEDTPYTLYYVAVDLDNKVTPVKSIDIMAQPVEEPDKSTAEINKITGHYKDNGLWGENYWYEVEFSEPIEGELELDQFELTCPAQSGLTLGRVEKISDTFFKIYMKVGVVPESNNTFTMTVRFKDGTQTSKSFYFDIEPPIVTAFDVKATTEGAIKVSFRASEEGVAYYKVYDKDEFDDNVAGKDPTDIYETGESKVISYGTNIIETTATEGQWFCLVLEDTMGNRMAFIERGQVPAYVPPEPEVPDAIKIMDIKPGVDSSGRPYVEVTFNQVVKIQTQSSYAPEITNLSGKKALYEITYKGGDSITGSEVAVIKILNGLKINAGEHLVRVYIDGKLYEGEFTTTEVIG